MLLGIQPFLVLYLFIKALQTIRHREQPDNESFKYSDGSEVARTITFIKEQLKKPPFMGI